MPLAEQERTIVERAYLHDVERVAAALGTDPLRGLDEEEALARLERHGLNELPAESPAPWWRKLLAQFESALVLLLLVATAISAALWAYERDAALPYEALAILVVVCLNAAMGCLQEARAERALTALRALSAAESTVIRGGVRRRVPSSRLVPGDLLQLEEGDAIAADARVVESIALTTGEAALTGESLPVEKGAAALGAEVEVGARDDMVYSGTVVSYGRGKALVTATARDTELGRIATLLERTREEPTPLQRELDRTGKRLGAGVALIAVIMMATLLLVQDVSCATALFDVLILGVALAVAAVPEGLPAVVTAVLAIGVQRMARRHAVVRKLAAVESLGSASIIASDKTGTLTKNEMTVREVVTASGTVSVGGSGYAPEGTLSQGPGGEVEGPLRHELERALSAGDRASNAEVVEQGGRWVVLGDPTEGALLVAARKAGLSVAGLDARLPRIEELPFSSERKLMSTVHRDTEAEGELVVFTKGAPDALLPRCSEELVGERARPLDAARREAILAATDELADRALRTLAVAVRRLPREHVFERGARGRGLEQQLVFVGLIGMLDPPRPEAVESVARAKGAGIRPVMITGDHPRTAAVIARELGIASQPGVLTGAEIDALDDEALAARAERVDVYARVSPSHKLRIVHALKRGGAVVAMTGDGVNDAPALKAADIGVSMGITGTEVAKEASDIVLVDDNFASIVAAVEEGRAIYANIRKFLRYLLSSNIGEVLTMFLGVVFAGRLGIAAHEGEVVVLPLLATQILWTNLVSDGAPALALGLDPPDEASMRAPPRHATERVITRGMWWSVLWSGALIAVGTLYVLDATLPGGLVEGDGELRRAQTMAFTTLVLFQMFNVLNARSDRASAFSGLLSNGWLWAAIGVSVALQLAVVHLPFLQVAFGTTALTTTEWLRCVGVASTVLWAKEATKLASRWLERASAQRSPA